MSREFIRPISKKQFNSISNAHVKPPLELISDLQQMFTPAARLRLRSIRGEFFLSDLESRKPKNSIEFGHHHLLVRHRQMKHAKSDLGTADLKSRERYSNVEQRIEEELGLGKHTIVFEKTPFGTPGMVSTVLEQFEEGEIDPQIMHKYNRERSRGNHKEYRR